MNHQLSLQRRILITSIITVVVWSHMLWDYFHGGIPEHYVLHIPNLPATPNWLGGSILPFFTFYLLHRIHKRIDFPDAKVTIRPLKIIVLRCVGAALVSGIIAVCFMNGIDAID
ncbi:MAG: hypothetical protein WA810_11530 [Maribacter sp.]